MSVSKRIVDALSHRTVRGGCYVLAFVFFFLIVLIPTVSVLSYLFTDWGAIQTEVFARPDRMALIYHALFLSFAVAGVVAVFDLLAGLPLAWFLVRKEFRGKSFLNSLIDSPLAVPTAGLGFSVALFWGITNVAGKPAGAYSLFGGTNSAFAILVLLHFATTFPYMVRSISAILEEIDASYEVAARTCGASRLTAARTVTLPMFRAGLATGLTLVVAKALSDTGGVMSALAAIGSAELNGTALIGTWKSGSSMNPDLIPALSFVSILMILLAILLLLIVKVVTSRGKIPIRRVWPTFERRLSKGAAPKLRDAAAFGFLIIAVLIPSFFLVGFVATADPQAGADWTGFWNSISLSFFVAAVATVVDLGVGLPVAIFITRSQHRRAAGVMDTLVNIPYIVPSAALGFSLGLFWTGWFSGIPTLLLVVMAHVAFTFPFIVRNVVGAMEELDPSLEETARTLGARPIQVFRRVTFPIIKASILAGAIMAFTRSIGETGATLAVSPDAITAPVFIVGLVQNEIYYQAALATIILIVISFTAMMIMRIVTRRAK
jgi:thiamine transport system permease protein